MSRANLLDSDRLQSSMKLIKMTSIITEKQIKSNMIRLIYIKQGSHFLSIIDDSFHWNLNYGDVFIYNQNTISTMSGTYFTDELENYKCQFIDFHAELHLLNIVLFDFTKLIALLTVAQLTITYYRNLFPVEIYILWSVIYLFMMFFIYFNTYNTIIKSNRIIADLQ
jgi:hypothetical protein